MPFGFTVTVLKNDRSSSCLERGFLRCFVRQDAAPFQTRRFIYCLHCFKLGSYSWFDYHKIDASFDMSKDSLSKHISRFPQYVQDITSELEMLNEGGKLFKKSPVADTGNERLLDLADLPVQLRLRPSEEFDDAGESDSDENDLGENDGDDERLNFKMLVDCLTDCFD